jgi:glutaredoxin
MDAPDEKNARCELPEPEASTPAPTAAAGTRIYGKLGCPHTERARRALPGAAFIDVLADPARLEEMLALSGGVRRVPVIVRGTCVEIGFRRGA